MKVDVIAESKYLKDYWKSRNDQILEDRNTVNLVKEVRTRDKLNWISNEPKVFYDTAVALVSAYPPRFRLPLTTNPDSEEKEKMSKAERFLLGIWRQLDRRQLDRGMSYWLKELAYWTLSGWYAIFNIVDVRDGETVFIADLWDPMTVYPEWDSDGLRKCIRSFEVDRQTALAMVDDWRFKGLQTEWKEPSRRGDVEIINYWRKDIKRRKPVISNAIYAAGKEVKPLTEEKRFKRIPIHVGAVGNPERGTTEWQRRWGEPIIASNRDMYAYTNAIIKLLATILSETAYPNIVTKTQSGDPSIKEEDLTGYGAIIPLRLNEQIELLKHAAAPAETADLLGMLIRQQQKGSIPDVVYGGINIELSGFAISQLMAAIKYKIGPYLNTMQYSISQIATNFLEQYRDGGFPKITLPTFNPKSMKKGMFFAEEFSSKDVPDRTFVDVVIPVTTSLDRTQQILFARQAMEPPQLLSRETLWDEFLDVQDSEQEYARILQDEMLEMPIVKQLGLIEQMRERQRLFETQGRIGEAQALKRYIMALEMELGMRQGIPTTPNAPNPSPNLSPPEMGQSPDRTRAVMGVPPPGVNRPTAQPENVGRRGRVLSPTGEVLIR